MTAQFHLISDESTGRIKVRTIGLRSMAEEAAAKAVATGKSSLRVDHGGSVCNSYGYSAETEVGLVVAVHMGGVVHVAMYKDQIPANKVSYSGAAAACLPCARPIFDDRYGAAAKSAARKATVRAAKADIGRKLDPQYAAKRRERQLRRPPEAPKPGRFERMAEERRREKAAARAEERRRLIIVGSRALGLDTREGYGGHYMYVPGTLTTTMVPIDWLPFLETATDASDRLIFADYLDDRHNGGPECQRSAHGIPGATGPIRESLADWIRGREARKQEREVVLA